MCGLRTCTCIQAAHPSGPDLIISFWNLLMMTAVSGASDVCGCRSVVIIQSDSFRINAAEIGRFELSSRLVREERIIRKKQPTSIFFFVFEISVGYRTYGRGPQQPDPKNNKVGSTIFQKSQMSRLGDGCVAGGGRNPTRDSRLRTRFSLSSFQCLFAQLDDWLGCFAVLWPATLRRLLVSLNLFVTLLTV